MERGRNPGSRNLAALLERSRYGNCPEQLGHRIRSGGCNGRSHFVTCKLALGVLRRAPAGVANFLDPTERSRARTLAASPGPTAPESHRTPVDVEAHPPSFVHSSCHEHVRHVRVVGTVYLDPGLSCASCRSWGARLHHLRFHLFSDCLEPVWHVSGVSAIRRLGRSVWA